MLAGSRERLRSRAFQGALAMLLLIGLLWGWRVWSEPRYLGRGIRSWLEQLPYDTSSSSEAQRAMDSFGERALPYLIEAVERPMKWDRGWLAKVPRRYLDYVVDLNAQHSVQLVALGRFEELARDEVERNELSLTPRYPIVDQLLALWQSSQNGAASSLPVGFLGNIGDRVTNVVADLKGFIRTRTPNQYEWFTVAQLLAMRHDPELTPILLKYTGTNYPFDWRSSSIRLLSANALTNAEVAEALKNGLSSTNQYLRTSAILSSASLNICTKEALDTIRIRRDRAPYVGANELKTYDVAEPILLWRSGEDAERGKRWIERNLHGTWPERLQTISLLERAGPIAASFASALARLAQEPSRFQQAAVVHALKLIDPNAARKVVQELPPPGRVLRAAAAKAE